MKHKNVYAGYLKYAPYFMMLPFLLFFLVFKLGPILWAVLYSFMKWDGMTQARFIGLGNYVSLFRNERFWIALRNTLFFVVVYNSLMICLALFIAVLVSTEGIAAKRFFRTLYFIPITVSLAIVAIVFDRIMARDVGFINILLKLVLKHPGDIGFLVDRGFVMPSFIVMRMWRATGYYAAFMYAGLLSVPKEIYESVKMDGAGPVRTFFSITIPLIMPVIVFCLIMSTVWSFQLFDEPWILNMGGPADASLTLQILLYQVTFTSNKFGLGCAVSWLMTIIMVGFSMLYSYILEGKYSVSPKTGLV